MMDSPSEGLICSRCEADTEIFRLLHNETFSNHWGATHMISLAEAMELTEGMRGLMDPELVVFCRMERRVNWLYLRLSRFEPSIPGNSRQQRNPGSIPSKNPHSERSTLIRRGQACFPGKRCGASHWRKNPAGNDRERLFGRDPYPDHGRESRLSRLFHLAGCQALA